MSFALYCTSNLSIIIKDNTFRLQNGISTFFPQNFSFSFQHDSFSLTEKPFLFSSYCSSSSVFSRFSMAIHHSLTSLSITAIHVFTAFDFLKKQCNGSAIMTFTKSLYSNTNSIIRFTKHLYSLYFAYFLKTFTHIVFRMYFSISFRLPHFK